MAGQTGQDAASATAAVAGAGWLDRLCASLALLTVPATGTLESLCNLGFARQVV